MHLHFWTRPVPTQGLPVGQLVKNCAMGETWVRSLAWEDALEKGTATHYSVLAWRIQRTLQSVGHREVETTERPSLSQHTAVPLTLPLASPAHLNLNLSSYLGLQFRPLGPLKQEILVFMNHSSGGLSHVPFPV